MIHQLLVPLDGSDLAESILPAVQAFARLTGARVTLLQAVEFIEEFTDLTGVRAAGRDLDPQAAKERAAHTYLAAIAQRLAAGGIPTETAVAVGDAADEILRAGGAVDLIAMATHDRSGIGRWVHGSVADKVVRHAPVPVLLIRARHDGDTASSPRRILVPLDGSPLAEQALPLATMLARLAGAELILVRAVDWLQETAGISPDLAGLSARELGALAIEDARAYLHALRPRLEQQGLTVRTATPIDPVAEAILEVAAHKQVDLIVMTTHGHSGLRRWVFGSIANRLLQAAPIPILLVRVNASSPAAATLPPAGAVSA